MLGSPVQQRRVPMLRTVLAVAAVVGAAVASGVSVPIERPDVPAASVTDDGTVDRDDFTNRDDFDGGNGGEGANG
jgi:hypothetical protein